MFFVSDNKLTSQLLQNNSSFKTITTGKRKDDKSKYDEKIRPKEKLQTNSIKGFLLDENNSM